MSRPRLIKEASAPLQLEKELLLRIHDLMVKTRALEERLIQMYKQGHGYFWIGGPGEEAFNVPLGLLMKKGEGPAYDYLHAHYRQSGTILALGEEPIGALRQMKYMPEFRFRLDTSYDNMSKIDRLLRSPEVARDLDKDGDA